jgi:hypothetical protein
VCTGGIAHGRIYKYAVLRQLHWAAPRSGLSPDSSTFDELPAARAPPGPFRALWNPGSKSLYCTSLAPHRFPTRTKRIQCPMHTLDSAYSARRFWTARRLARVFQSLAERGRGAQRHSTTHRARCWTKRLRIRDGTGTGCLHTWTNIDKLEHFVFPHV